MMPPTPSYFRYCFLLLLFALACGKSDQDCFYDKDCSDYISQLDAQAAYDRDPECRSYLDADNDGCACEDWASYYQNGGSGNGGGGSGGGTDCPNTSACGCSGHNMLPCQMDVCCKWTTGQGCGCR